MISSAHDDVRVGRILEEF